MTVNGIRQLGETTQLITISDDCTIAVWESTNQTQLAVIPCFSRPSALDVNLDGTVAFVGFDSGIYRIFDVSNRQQPRLVSQLKLLEEEVSLDNIQVSNDGKLVLVSSSGSDLLYVCSARIEDKFEVYGFYKLGGLVLSSSFASYDGQTVALAVLSNNLLAQIKVPTEI